MGDYALLDGYNCARQAGFSNWAFLVVLSSAVIVVAFLGNKREIGRPFEILPSVAASVFDPKPVEVINIADEIKNFVSTVNRVVILAARNRHTGEKVFHCHQESVVGMG